MLRELRTAIKLIKNCKKKRTETAQKLKNIKISSIGKGIDLKSLRVA